MKHIYIFLAFFVTFISWFARSLHGNLVRTYYKKKVLVCCILPNKNGISGVKVSSPFFSFYNPTIDHFGVRNGSKELTTHLTCISSCAFLFFIRPTFLPTFALNRPGCAIKELDYFCLLQPAAGRTVRAVGWFFVFFFFKKSSLKY